MKNIDKSEKEFRIKVINNQSRINNIEAVLKRSYQKNNFRFFIATLIATIALITTIYIVLLNKSQIEVEEKALSEYKIINSSDLENYKAEIDLRFNESVGYINIGIPKIKFDDIGNEWVIEVPTKNVGQNPISNFFTRYTFFYTKPMISSFVIPESIKESVKDKKLKAITPIDFKTAKKNKIAGVLPTTMDNLNFRMHEVATDLVGYGTNYVNGEEIILYIQTGLKKNEVLAKNDYLMSFEILYSDKFTKKQLTEKELYKFNFIENSKMYTPNINEGIYFMTVYNFFGDIENGDSLTFKILINDNPINFIK